MTTIESQRSAMVESQLRARGISDPHVLDAMATIPREAFVEDDDRSRAYEDRALSIAAGQTISQPYVVALMLEAARLTPEARVLEVGAGSGYAAAVAAQICAHVHAVEFHAELADLARGRLATLGIGNVTVINADGSQGLSDFAPFDAILVAAGVDEAPDPLKRQLTVGGRLVIPLGDTRSQALCVIERTGPEDWRETSLGGVRFVPLVGEHGR
ncbi:protein-L-isoaspartate(D-aspartate) O-methyltransferase [Aurantiacibacter spongiae]|uniref:Protein-L-isoaspartate O-methyltransferase n=1 Tax=Aurantiacibacter spongiae TaxID=2488860 RepID=A0A3N5DQ20_9SPHN|nr:protein-L-isoaspartate(D-aspartate) O-methyltransferase [Aurantiacibacter spongiae]RPF71241.1 protein-L-isoaspartate(D-aspartate) O-methyltransferase [Aurantiacibacter spongiae]